jgi:hypothetical protein
MNTIQAYTLFDLIMNVSGEKYILPFSSDVSDDDIVQKVAELFQNAKIHEHKIYKEFYPDEDEDENIVYHCARTNTTEIKLKCIYCGKNEPYDFSIVMELFRFSSLSDDNITYEDGTQLKDGQWMIALTIKQEEGDLFEELIELKVIPKLIAAAGLSMCKYKI